MVELPTSLMNFFIPNLYHLFKWSNVRDKNVSIMATDLIKAGVETLYVSNVPQNVYSA